MDKIVILTNSSERSGRFVSFLRMLFPACEIEIQSRELYGDNSGKPARDSENEKMKFIVDN